MKAIKLIEIYYRVCQIYNEYLWQNVQRFSPNGNQGEITDQELMCIYLFCLIEEQKMEKKAMHRFIKDYWADWFPNLPSYQTFCDRLNRLEAAFEGLISYLIAIYLPDIEQDFSIFIGDSMPIITCSGKRKAKVAPDLCTKSYCSSKNMWYYGVKLHTLGHKREQKLAFPIFMGITPAHVHDLSAIREELAKFPLACVVLDKAYCDQSLAQSFEGQNRTLLCPIKMQKGESEAIKQRDKAYQDLYNRKVSSLRQPIEAFFSWIEQKFQIQRASKVRAKAGLALHVFAKLAAAVWVLSEQLKP